MSDNRIIFITGSNRGIGLEYARQLSRRGDTVIAGYRSEASSKELLDMAAQNDRFFAVRVDVTSVSDLEQVRDFIKSKFGYLDMLINNAGIQMNYSTPIDDIEPDDIQEHIRVNVVGPFLSAKILRPLLAKSDGAKLINISSRMGSIEVSWGGATSYRISKAAVNMLSKQQSLEYADDGIITIALHPGWVRTDLGGPDAPLSPIESVTGMIKVIDALTPDDNGAFLGYDGQPCPY